MELAEHIDNIMTFPSDEKSLDNGRYAYWDDATGTIVIYDPSDSDKGTAFIPTRGKKYFDEQ